MKQYKIVVDFIRKEPFMIYQRDSFFESFKLVESTPTHEEAIIFCNGKNGKFIGTYSKDGVAIAKNEVLSEERYVPHSSDNNINHTVGEPAESLDENEDVLFSRVIKGKKCF